MFADAPYPPVSAYPGFGSAVPYPSFGSYGAEPAWSPSYWSAPHSYGDASPYPSSFGSYGYSSYGGGPAGGYAAGYGGAGAGAGGGYAPGYGHSSAHPQYGHPADGQPYRGSRLQIEGPAPAAGSPDRHADPHRQSHHRHHHQQQPEDEPRPSPPKSRSGRSHRAASEAPSALSRGSTWSMYSAYLPKELRPRARRASASGLVKAHKDERVRSTPQQQLRDVTPGEDEQSFISTYFSKDRKERRVRVDPPAPGAPPPPPNPRSRLNLLESLVVLKAHDQGVFQDHERLLDYILCGGLLLELFSQGRIDIHPNTIRYPTELTVRVGSDQQVQGELLQGALERLELVTRSQHKSVAQLINLLYMGLKESISKNILNRCVNKGWLRESADHGRRAEYKVANRQVYEEARGAIDQLMEMRDNEAEPPIRFSVLGTMYWAPQDYTNYCFGRSQEAYPAQQLCKAFVFAIQKFAERL